MNNCVFIGRITKDVELKYTPNGVPVARFTLAVDRDFKNREGERETDFIDHVVWNKLAEVCAKNLGKGRLVATRGRLQIRSYEDDNGVRRRVAEIITDTVKFLDWPKNKQDNGNNNNNANNDNQLPDGINFDDSDVPF